MILYTRSYEIVSMTLDRFDVDNDVRREREFFPKFDSVDLFVPLLSNPLRSFLAH